MHLMGPRPVQGGQGQLGCPMPSTRHYRPVMPDPDAVLQKQVAYYRERAVDYLDQARRVQGFDELGEALLAFRPFGDVLELACGPGTWTPMLMRTAATVTAVDAASEMLDQARRRVGESPVRFVQADVFSWRPDRRYDTVFFGFSCRTFRPTGSMSSGASCRIVSRPPAASSSWTTLTGRPRRPEAILRPPSSSDAQRTGQSTDL